MQIKKTLITGVLIAALTGAFWAGHSVGASESTKKEITRTALVRWEESSANSNDWGEMRTYFRGETHGTVDMLSAFAVIKPGEAAHPAHRHAAEEFLVITEGSGTWSLQGKKMPAKKGDVIYTEPWAWHGLVNTGDEPLTFYVVKWTSKGVEVPKEPEGDHGR